jgi:dipeptidyl aminopeptidase/acylaminoacyl peptidase
VYSPPGAPSGPGHLLFARGSTLFAVTFDADRLEILGDPAPVAGSILHFSITGGGIFSVSANGVLAYGTKGNRNTRLTWFDRQGRVSSSLGPAAEHLHVDLAPDDKRVLFEQLDPDTGNGQIWLADLERGVTSRLSVASSWDLGPVWSPDGTRFAFGSTRSGSLDLYQRLAAGSADGLLLKSTENKGPTGWTPDSRSVLFWSNSLGGASSVSLNRLALDDPGHPEPLVRSDAVLNQGKVSPEGRWLAYTSNESGRLEVYVRPFASSEGKWQISSTGGSQPRWRRDGRELFYLAADRRLMSVAVGGKERFEVQAPQPLFQTRALTFFERYDYAVTADGQRFLVNTRVEEGEPSEIVVVTRWAAGWKAKP